MKTNKLSALFVFALMALSLSGWSCGNGFGVNNNEPETSDETTDATADWQTYRDDTYGVEFKYPQGWVATPETQQTLSLLIVDFKAVGDESPDSGITFSVDGKTLDQTKAELLADADMETLQREEISINGVQWLKDISKDRETSMQFLTYFCGYNSRTYQLSIVYAGASPDGLTNERDTETLNGLLGSFKFVE